MRTAGVARPVFPALALHSRQFIMWSSPSRLAAATSARNWSPRRPAVRFVIAVCVVGPVLLVATRTGARTNLRDDAPAAALRGELEPADAVAIRTVDDFSAFVLRRTTGETDDVEASVLEGLRLLEAAVAAIAAREGLGVAPSGIPDERGTRAAASPQWHPGSHPVALRFRSNAEAITALQRRRFEPLARAAAQLHHAAQALRDDLPAALQRDAVDLYFERASDILRGMAEMKL